MAISAESVPYISVCSGGGGLDAGVRLAIPSARCVCYVEREAPAVAALVAAMEAGALDDAPVWDDASTFDGKPWRGKVAGVVGGTPCQDLSLAGKRAGLHGERSGIFFEFVRIVRECQPEWVLWENVGGAVGAIPEVCAEFESSGYSGAWARVRASDVGATHERARIFLLAYRKGIGERERHHAQRSEPRQRAREDAGWGGVRRDKVVLDDVGHGYDMRQLQPQLGEPHQRGWVEHACASGLPLWPPGPADADTWQAVLQRWPHLAPALPQPGIRGVVDGLALASGGLDRIELLRLLGNGVVPQQAAHAIRGLAQALLHSEAK